MPWLARETLCNKTIDSVEDFYSCIETLLYSRDQLILETVFFSFSGALVKPATNAKWENYIEALIHGRCQTIRNVGRLPAAQNFKAILNTSLDLGAPYKVWLHDPDFYVESINPSSSPRIDITLNLTGCLLQMYSLKFSSFILHEGRDLGGFQYIRAEKHVLMQREDQQCRDYANEGTTFSECISISAMNSTGCKVG